MTQLKDCSQSSSLDQVSLQLKVKLFSSVSKEPEHEKLTLKRYVLGS
jgi:hypothetical protein